MAIHRRDDELENVLAGRLDGDRADRRALLTFVDALRSTSATPPTAVRPELDAIFETGLAPGDGELGDLAPVTTARPAAHPSRRRRMLGTLSAFVATLAGKVVLSTAAVAVSVGGAQAAGVVDVPGLPDPAPAGAEHAPAVDDGGSDEADTGPEADTGEPDEPGVDGDSVSDRATDGEPQEDGKEFGDSVSDEATGGTPAEGLPGNRGDVADDRRSDTADRSVPDPTIPDPTVPDQAKPDQAKPDDAGGSDAADEYRPYGAPADRP